MWRLINQNKNPPGNFPYEQTEGIPHKFPPKSVIIEQAKRVADFRKGNKLGRSSLAEALQDVDCYQCQRLGNNPTYCYNDSAEAYQAVGIPAPSGCPTCGAKIA